MHMNERIFQLKRDLEFRQMRRVWAFRQNCDTLSYKFRGQYEKKHGVPKKRRSRNNLSSNLYIPLKSCLRLIITSSDTNYKVRDEFLCRPRRARKYICPAIAGYLLAADIRFVLSPLHRAERLRADLRVGVMVSVDAFHFYCITVRKRGGF